MSDPLTFLRALTDSNFLHDATPVQPLEITVMFTRDHARLAATMFAVAALVASAVPARAAFHMRLTKAEPAQDAALAVSPEAVRLWFSEPAEAATSKIGVSGPGGSAALDAVTRDPIKGAPLVAKVTKPLAEGAYVVSWKAMSKDGHVVSGSYGFKVAAKK